MTRYGLSLVYTTIPPSTAWARTPPTRPADSQTRSRRNGIRRRAARKVPMTMMVTTTVTIRFPNSITGCRESWAVSRRW